MPKRNQVPRLEILCIKCSCILLAQLGRQYGLNKIRQLLRYTVPWPLIEQLSFEFLHVVQKLIEETKRNHDPLKTSMPQFLQEMNSVVVLTDLVLGPEITRIDLPSWPKIMRYVLFRGLNRLSYLRSLDLGACLVSWGTDHSLLLALSNMKYLQTLSLCFDCSDQIIQVVANHCSNLTYLDVTGSRPVTDKSVIYLSHCQQLKQLQLNYTSVTVAGYVDLLLHLPNLEDFGRCDQLGAALQKINEILPNQLFNLRKFQSRYVSLIDLQHLSKMCPKLQHISIFYSEDTTKNLLSLTSFSYLTELKLLSCNFYSNSIKVLLEIIGANLTVLHLEHVDELDLSALVSISQYCPKISNLVLYNCDLSYHNNYSNNCLLKTKPFQSLERIFCVADGASLHLKFLLTYCVNIKYIHLGSSTGINHQLLMSILQINPMIHLEELRILHGSDLSLTTVNAILNSCPKLRLLSELEGWNGISITDLQNFKQFIHKNNFDLDVKPTLYY